ncbi:hypothetical protein FGO68_gene7374 [Halteria grandinella]|uniref:Uncharacterized protein n=1 Tax=Halteria grandinella TaxID=5974 RepID=A0A8J8P5E6_HALGN|nr:hypothetical protein FGO68_gene7374 [Halteria grandinella]
MGAQQGKGEATAAPPKQPAQQPPNNPAAQKPPSTPVQQQPPGAKPPTPQPALQQPSPISQQKQPTTQPVPQAIPQVTQRTAGGQEDEEGEEEMDTIQMGQTAGGTNRATFIGNTVRDPKNPTGSVDPLQKQAVTNSLAPGTNTLQKSDPNQILNRFKDEPAAANTLKQSQGPSQAQVNTAIESYQQQLKDMKQSVNDMGRITNGLRR